MFSEVGARDLIGKRVILGVTHVTREGRLVRQDQFHGRITRANRSEGFVVQTSSAAEICIPPDLRAFFGARPGVYTLRSTGEEVVDPDLTTTWTHTLRQP